MENTFLECSGCGNNDITVHRDKYDGQCADCTNKALESESFMKKSEKRNKYLKANGK